MPVCLAAGVAACGTDEGAKKDDKPVAAAPAEAPPPPPLEPAGLCLARARVDDAVALGKLPALRAELVRAHDAAKHKDPTAAYATMLAIENDQERWKAFKDYGEVNPGVRDLGECEIYSQWKMDDQAAGPCQRALAASPSLVLVDVAQARREADRGDVDAALARLDAARTRTPGCAPVAMARADILKDKGDAAAAAAAWGEASSLWPECASCAIARAELVEAAEGIEAALPLWEAALSKVPTHGPTLQRYAAAQVGRDDEKALAAYEKALERNGDDFGTLIAAAQLAKKIGQSVKAVQYAEKAAGLQPDSVDVWRLLVALYQAREETTGFEKALQEVLRLLPDDGQAHHELGRLAHKDGDFVRALTHYEAAVAGFAAEAEGGKPVASAEEQAATTEELKALRTELLIEDPGPTGDANRVVGQVQRTARRIYEQRLKQKKGLAGTVQLRVRTNKEGEVIDVEVTGDSLQDTQVVACLVGNLRAATISGGAQRLSFELSFE